nr:PREDICTED: uncharacterized protein LOC109040277 [Bemisia tabaci]
MVMTNDQPSHFYGFNNGEPFILEKIPETKSDATKGTTLSSGLGDYYEDIEGDDKHVIVKDNKNYKPDSIDRKDNVHKYYRPNDIPSNPFKITSDLHQFLNLPVHYSTSDKFPLISNSYANMKIQGTGSNHKQSPSTSSTTSTVSPSYYTMKHSPTSDRSTTPVTTLRSTSNQFTTSTTPSTTESTTVRRLTTTTAATTTTSKRPSSIFDFEDLAYSDYDYDTAGSSSYPQKPPINEYDQPIVKPTSPKSTTMTENLEIKTSESTSTTTTQSSTTTTTTTESPPSSTRLTSSYSAAASTTRPSTTTTTTTMAPTTTTTPKVSIVTSLPIDSSNAYYISQGASGFSKASEGTEKSTQSTRVTEENKIHQQATTYSGPQYHAVNNNRDGQQNEKPTVLFNFNGGDEPFRPIHNPEHYQPKNSSQRPVQTQTEDSNYYLSTLNPYQTGVKKPVPPHIPMKPPGSEFIALPNGPLRVPPKPDHMFQQKPMHQAQMSQINQQYRPLNNGPHFPPSTKPNQNKYNMSYHTPPELRPPSAPVKKTEGSSTTKYQNAEDLTFVNMKPGKPQQNIQVPPVKQSDIVQGHPMGNIGESQSYSLQTSFSIGVPDNENSASSNNIRPAQGIGQVLPANDETEATRPGQVLNTQRLTQSVRPGMVQQLPSKPVAPNRPPQDHSRPQNKPIQRHPSGSPLPVRPPPNNRPPQMSDAKPQSQGNYPRPHWESHSGKPQFMNGNNQVSAGPNQPGPIHGKEKPQGQYYPMNRGKPEVDNKQPLPNILPQFRPNAKVGTAEYPPHGNHPQYGPNHHPQMERRREPTDKLRPPPLPRPQFLRINRNDDENSMVDEEIRESLLYPEKESRTNQRPSMNAQQPSRVTTLQMMQHGSAFAPQRLVRNEETLETKAGDKKPVHLVYPMTGKTSQQKNEGVVIVGVKGPQRPLPPPDLDLTDDDQSFPMVDKQKPFPLPARDRPDTPILKTKLNIKPIKNDFPYPLVKPNANAGNEDTINNEKKYHELAQNNIKPDSNSISEYTAYSPTKRTDIDVEDDMTKLADEAVNLIPYLQDYMPYATKKPLVKIPTKSPVYKKDPLPDWASEKYESNKPISVTLTNTPAEEAATENRTSDMSTRPSEPFYSGLLQTEENKRVAVINKNSNGNEYTLSTIMHTHPTQQKESIEYEPISSSGSYSSGSFNHKPQTPDSVPQSVNLEAPFQASISAPQHETHGWSVIGSIRRPEDELDRSDSNHTVHQTEAQTEESTFDFDNFKPQLMGGFKPILPPSAEDTAMETESDIKIDSEEAKS